MGHILHLLLIYKLYQLTVDDINIILCFSSTVLLYKYFVNLRHSLQVEYIDYASICDSLKYDRNNIDNSFNLMHGLNMIKEANLVQRFLDLIVYRA